jgi:hypothetical protein
MSAGILWKHAVKLFVIDGLKAQSFIWKCLDGQGKQFSLADTHFSRASQAFSPGIWSQCPFT